MGLSGKGRAACVDLESPLEETTMRRMEEEREGCERMDERTEAKDERQTVGLVSFSAKGGAYTGVPPGEPYLHQ